jgi:hypothetical protein
MNATVIGMPTNSATVNCQPIRIAITRFLTPPPHWCSPTRMPSPRRSWRHCEKSSGHSATAAYEREDDAAPRPQATASALGESSGSKRVISRFETTAWTIAESVNPSASAPKSPRSWRTPDSVPAARPGQRQSWDTTSMREGDHPMVGSTDGTDGYGSRDAATR